VFADKTACSRARLGSADSEPRPSGRRCASTYDAMFKVRELQWITARSLRSNRERWAASHVSEVCGSRSTTFSTICLGRLFSRYSRYHTNRMFRYFGQFFAIVAALASAINAQCALSCSLQTVTRSAAHETSNVHSPRTGHPCCPEQKAPVPSDQNRQQQPCPDPLPTISDIRAATALQHLDAPQSFDLASGYSFDLVPPVHRSPLPVVVDSSGFHDAPAFSVLRI
jgi:hypothetical protein